MRILLIAYEFPPSTSPQSLRWERLAAGLAARGHQVVALVPGWDEAWLPPRGMRMERTSPGWLPDLVGTLARLGRGKSERRPLPIPRFDARLNVRGMIASVLSKPFELVCFPDLRAQWNRQAASRLRAILSENRPDVVITSHEPASVLELGFIAAEQGIPWVADLGDPVLAPYTPRRWRARARRLEAEVCKRASAVLVTSDAYRDQLARTHPAKAGACKVLRQGFDPSQGDGPAMRPEQRKGDTAFLDIVFTGRFYRFRDPRPLLAAIAQVPEVRLTIATPGLGSGYESQLGALGDRARIVGMLAPTETYTLQRRADILLSIGNTLALQVPGKLFEYMGAGRPILHLAGLAQDEGSMLVREHRRGWVVSNETEAIRNRLAMLVQDWKRGRLEIGLNLAREEIERYSWPSLTAALEATLEKIANGARE